ncbi:tyrosine-type recombinase/integrase [Gemmata sp. JC717]|uniref:tyrosine-type recombinase/integrase n=1 Tax=Gemmata algarum TaxID=2975278 RepID=UPI0021BB3443|nr:tyrosine-type recombinase/integrase [Gemmata algarum]MDY3551359.1 tyrosine-type recombinase/integrase [Gemmata algarum]
MAHQPKPFFRTGRGWYVQLGKQQIKLCPGPENTETEKAAWAAFHTLMAERAKPRPASPNSANSATLTVVEVFEKFLDWCQKHRSERTYEWSKGHIQAFCDHLPDAAMPATDLRPFHVVEWVDSKPTWGANQKRGAIVAVTRPFNWAAKLGYITASPVRGVEKPTPTKRHSRMTPEDFTKLIGFVKDEPFRDLLTFAYEAGCRPQEARLIEARHLKLDQHRVEIPPSEAKGKRRWRVIYLSERAAAIVRRLAELRPTGPLFLNVDGNPWQAQAIVCRFQRLLVKLAGVEQQVPRLPRFNYRTYTDPAERAAAKKAHQEKLVELRKERAKLARQGDVRFAMYDLRHCFASRKLKEGHDPITVAALLGHKDGTMLCRHYEGISTDGDHLRAAVTDGSGA